MLKFDENDELITNDDEPEISVGFAPGRPAPARKAEPTPQPGWKKTLAQLRKMELDHRVPQQEPAAEFPDDRRIVYFVDVQRTLEGTHGLSVEVMLQKRQRGGTWDRPKSWSIDQRVWLNAPDEADRMIAQLLIGSNESFGWYRSAGAQWFFIPGSRYDTILRRMCETGAADCGQNRSKKICACWNGIRPGHGNLNSISNAAEEKNSSFSRGASARRRAHGHRQTETGAGRGFGRN